MLGSHQITWDIPGHVSMTTLLLFQSIFPLVIMPIYPGFFTHGFLYCADGHPLDKIEKMASFNKPNQLHCIYKPY